MQSAALVHCILAVWSGGTSHHDSVAKGKGGAVGSCIAQVLKPSRSLQDQQRLSCTVRAGV